MRPREPQADRPFRFPVDRVADATNKLEMARPSNLVMPSARSCGTAKRNPALLIKGPDAGAVRASRNRGSPATSTS